MQETVFLNDRKRLVTSTRVEIGDQTFATRNIGSVRLEKRGANWLALLMCLFGVYLCSSGAERAVGGAIFLFVGSVWAYWSTRQCKLHLIAGGGQVMALKSNDPVGMERLRAAIAQAISIR